MSRFCNSRVRALGMVYSNEANWSDICLNCDTIYSAHMNRMCPDMTSKFIRETYRTYVVTPQVLEYAYFNYFKSVVSGEAL